jgi:hypothetical protein
MPSCTSRLRPRTYPVIVSAKNAGMKGWEGCTIVDDERFRECLGVQTVRCGELEHIPFHDSDMSQQPSAHYCSLYAKTLAIANSVQRPGNHAYK